MNHWAILARLMANGALGAHTLQQLKTALERKRAPAR